MAERVKGVRDFTGKEALIRADAIEKIRKTYEEFGFEPIETPAFEYLSLFTNKSGPEIEEQLYAFEDKKGEKLALRPEHTISKLRVVSGNRSTVFPMKAYSIGNVWRYEDVRKGRWREFVQADIDVFGSSSLKYDAEVIACVDTALKKIGLSNFNIKLSNRKILQSLMEDLGVLPSEGIQVLREIDKKNKLGLEEVTKRISEIIGNEKAGKVRDFISSETAPASEGYKELSSVIDILNKDYGIKNTLFDKSLVRGQDYYDGTIIEFESTEKGFEGLVFAGGGRYDKLSKKFGSVFPIVGCSIGFDVVMEILTTKLTDDFIERYCVLNIDAPEKAVEIATKLRRKGLSTDMLLENVPLSKGLAYCASKRIRYAVIVGSKDLEKGEVTIRDLKDKKDTKIKETELL